MKPVLEWLKSNWLIVVLTLVTLAALPAGFFVSQGMSKDLVDKVQKTAEEDYKELDNVKLTYKAPAASPGGKDLEFPAQVPNKVLIAYFEERQKEVAEQAKGVIDEALKFNKGSRDVLVPGLFPAPDILNRDPAIARMAEAIINTRPAQWLKQLNAGSPPPEARLAGSLKEQRDQTLERLKATKGNDSLTDAESRKLTEELRAARLGEYRQQAARISIYADRASFKSIPEVIGQTTPSLRQCWDWQEQAWIIDDIVKTIADVNGAGEGGVANSIVKRIAAISVAPPGFATAGTDAPAAAAPADGSAPAEPTGTLTAPKINYNFSSTGRQPGTTNQLYDVRNVNLELIVSTSRLPQLFDALTRTNFMTVIGCELFRVEPLDEVHLAAGYYYGEESVVSAKIRVETIWLREWTRPFMPKDVKEALGVIEPKDPAKEAAEGAKPKRPAKPAAEGEQPAPAAPTPPPGG